MNTEKENLSRTIFNLIRTTSFTELIKHIQNPNINIWDLRLNEETIIQSLIINNFEKCFIDTLEEAKKRPDYTKDKLRKWLNVKSRDGSTAILFASYRGNLVIIKKLIEHEAYFDIVNHNGLNVFHLAAQGNHPHLIVFFKEKYKMDLDSTDCSGSTPLHLSCLNGSADVFEFLLKYKVNVNFKDREGNTPLHNAVKSDRIGLIKGLLIHGANREIKNCHDFTPKKIAEEKNNKKIVELFEDERELFGFKVWRFPLEKIQKENKNIYIFFTFEIITQFIVLHLIIPYFTTDSQRNTMLYISSIVFSLTLILYCYLLLCDPGKLKNQNQTLLEIADSNIKMNDICPICVAKKTDNSRHCVVCDFCVDNFDHHCFWFNNCIGRRNINFFFVFLLVLEINLAFDVFLGFCGYYFMSRVMWQFSRFILFFCIMLIFACSFAFVTILFLIIAFFNKSMKNKLKNIHIDGAKQKLMKSNYNDNPIRTDIMIN